jgi:26S proteasome regulatory subunit N11
MLMNLHEKNWTAGLRLTDAKTHAKDNEEAVKNILRLTKAYSKAVVEESSLTADQLKTRYVGKQDPKRHLEESVEKAMADNICQGLKTSVNCVCFAAQ